VEGQNIGTPKHVFQRLQSDAEAPGRILTQIRVIANHAHSKSLSPARYLTPDSSGADQSQRLAVQLGAAEAAAIPLTVFHGAIGGRYPAHQCEQEAHGEFRRRDGVPGWCVHHGDALFGSGIHIDGVDSDAGPADHLEAGGASQRPPGDPGSASHNDGVRLGQRFGQCVFLQARSFNQGEAGILGEGSETFPSDFVGHQNPIGVHERITSSSTCSSSFNSSTV
jgi:hypothetical protein